MSLFHICVKCGSCIAHKPCADCAPANEGVVVEVYHVSPTGHAEIEYDQIHDTITRGMYRLIRIEDQP